MSVLTERLLNKGPDAFLVDTSLAQAWREYDWEAADGPLTHEEPTRRCVCYRCGMGPLEGIELHRLALGKFTCRRHPPKHRMV